MGKNNIRIGSISPGLTKSEALENNTGPTVAEMVYANTPHLQSKGPSMSMSFNPSFILTLKNPGRGGICPVRRSPAISHRIMLWSQKFLTLLINIPTRSW